MSEHKTHNKTFWTNSLLLGSLALNLFMGGFIVSRLMAGPSSPALVSPVQPVAALDFKVLPDSIPMHVREDIENDVRRNQKALEAAYKDYTAQQQKINDLIRQPDVNVDDLREAFQALRDIQAEVQGPLHESMAFALANMNRNERELIVVKRDQEFPIQIITSDVTDGKKWRFEMGGNFTIDMDKIKRLNRLKELEIERSKELEMQAKEIVKRVEEKMKKNQEDNEELRDWLEEDRERKENHQP